jgi:hypothetical protein
MDAMGRLGLWPLRAAWALLALAAAGPTSDALDGRGSATVVLVAVLGYGAWTAGLVALLVPRTSSLTVVRVLAPGALAGTVAVVASGGETTAGDIAALLVAATVAIVALAPWVTDAFVDGSSYGPERRIALRTPPVIAVLAVATWAVVLAGAVAGPLLLAAEQWVPGGVALVIGWAVAAAGTRSLHQLSRRWLVLVPTGMVLHDPITMPEAQLFLRQTMDRLGPAPDVAPDDLATEDLTAGATGLAIELLLSEPVELLVRAGSDEAQVRATQRVLFTPALPGALLTAARSHRLPVG